MLNAVACTKYFLVIFIITLSPYIKAEDLIEPQGQVLTRDDYEKHIAKIEKTENKYVKEETALFNENIKKLIKMEQDKVLFMCVEQEYGYTKRFGIDTTNGWTCDFIIGLNDKFKGPLDDHGSTEYQLINIGTDSVTVKYKSEFHHGSFGENKTTIDEGAVEIQYRE